MRPVHRSTYTSEAGAEEVRQRYRAILSRWPLPNQQMHVPTRVGDTFVVATGSPDAPPLLLFHGSSANSAIWMRDAVVWSKYFRVYAVDMIGEPGLSAAARPPLATDAHALWLDDVLRGLGIERASIVGISLGGWLALDYSTRRPERVDHVVVICPAGLGRQKLGILIRAMVLRMFGAWGRRRMRESILGRVPPDAPPAVRRFMDFIALIHQHFRPRVERIPIFGHEALQRLRMPVLAILGGRDVLIDSAGTRSRLERSAPHAVIRVLPDAGHVVTGQSGPILEFLQSTACDTGRPVAVSDAGA